ncbi:MAG TPA: hypothetical protein VMP01_07195 [Pirellulaceae bacterium]|nr:hypothetical protein [Pirellulaceae bacterium]
MKQTIKLAAPQHIAEHIGLSHFRFTWENDPPNSGEMIRDAVAVFRGGTEEPLEKYGCFIQVYDESDLTTKEESPFEWVFELVHEFGQSFHEWRLYKREKQPEFEIQPYYE